MNQQKLANALRKLGEASYELADALLDSPESGTLPAAGGVTGAPPLATPPEFPPLEPWSDSGPMEYAATTPAMDQVQSREYVLSRCPDHDKPWTVKEGGVSKAGKAYQAFWRCNEKDANGYCSKKPDPSWVKTHNPESVLVGA